MNHLDLDAIVVDLTIKYQGVTHQVHFLTADEYMIVQAMVETEADLGKEINETDVSIKLLAIALPDIGEPALRAMPVAQLRKLAEFLTPYLIGEPSMGIEELEALLSAEE